MTLLTVYKCVTKVLSILRECASSGKFYWKFYFFLRFIFLVICFLGNVLMIEKDRDIRDRLHGSWDCSGSPMWYQLSPDHQWYEQCDAGSDIEKVIIINNTIGRIWSHDRWHIITFDKKWCNYIYNFNTSRKLP